MNFQSTRIVDPTLNASVRRIDDNCRYLDLATLRDFTLTWGADFTHPAIVNGTATGRYAKAGGMCYAEGSIRPGSNTTYGSGGFFINLPLPAKTAGALGQCLLFDASAGTPPNFYPGIVWPKSTRTAAYLVVGNGLWTGTAPIALAAGDVFQFSLWYPWTANV